MNCYIKGCNDLALYEKVLKNEKIYFCLSHVWVNKKIRNDETYKTHKIIKNIFNKYRDELYNLKEKLWNHQEKIESLKNKIEELK